MAKNGTIGLESAFGALLTILPLELVIEKLTAGKATFSIPSQPIAEGAIANLSLFTPEGKNTFSAANILSKSKNSAFLGMKTKGKAYGIFNQGQLILTE